ncbi:DUF3054 domain-containing protein [Mycolicibacterium komossense]|uniref:DUF3054 domain-containing protein n=1 Tax=Mycolicibacterium komossense TaxID=1779 RepID=A0ABT3C8A3_9MYCO|nr:DUF3054 domain-containing protein [Mycolicibacterium komossense]MCV7225693.1 DUF3054 domain-containing protein [Mycolicibacterium komossense]
MQHSPAPTRAASAGLAIDIACVLVFCAIGRRSHDEGITLAGVAQTAWPFLSGTAAGWLLSRGWRQPTAIVPTGVSVWVATVIIGMLLRKASSQGVAVSFVIVASLVTAAFLLGWRLVGRIVRVTRAARAK